MLLQIFKDSTDIGDDIVSFNGLKWLHERDYSVVLPHPTIEVLDTVSVAVDDLIKFKIDGKWRLITYVDKIILNQEKRTKTLLCYDIRKKMEKYYIGDLTESDWSGYSPNEIEYKYEGANPLHYWFWYISVLFLLRVIIHKCCNIDIDRIKVSEINGIPSPYTNFLGDILYGNLAFQWKQMVAIGKSSSTENNYDGANLLEVYHFILKALQIRMEYVNPESGFDVIFKQYSAYSIPSDDDVFSYAEKDLKKYDFVKVMLKYHPDIRDYYYAWSDLTEYSVKRPDLSEEGHIFFALNLIENAVIHSTRYVTDHWILTEMEYFSHDTFIYQYADWMQTPMMTGYKKIFIETNIDYDLDAMECGINISNRDISSDMAYLEEVI